MHVTVRHRFGELIDDSLLKAVTSLEHKVVPVQPWGEPLSGDGDKRRLRRQITFSKSNASLAHSRASSMAAELQSMAANAVSVTLEEQAVSVTPPTALPDLSNDATDDERYLAETIDFLEAEEAGADILEQDHILAQPTGTTTTIGDRLATLFLSKETNQVLRGIRKLFAEYGQGLEFDNADLLRGVLTLEKFYVNFNSPRTGDVVRDLSAIEVPRHFFKFALAAYGWKVGME